jgi:hypothetical protein
MQSPPARTEILSVLTDVATAIVFRIKTACQILEFQPAIAILNEKLNLSRLLSAPSAVKNLVIAIDADDRIGVRLGFVFKNQHDEIISIVPSPFPPKK